MLPEHGNRLVQLLLGDGIGTGENDGRCSFDLVIVELTKVLHIHLHLACIGHSHSVTQLHILHLLHSADHIGQLAHAGGFDDHAVGVILGNHLLQSPAEIAHQAAADAAGVHLCDVDAGFLQETAIDTDLTEFVFNEHQLLAAIAFCDEFFDQRRFAGTQKAGININFRHRIHLLYGFYFIPAIITP